MTRYDVFVASRFQEFEALREGLRRIADDHARVNLVMLDDGHSYDGTALDRSLSAVGQCDALVVFLGETSSDDVIPITESELTRADELGIPVIPMATCYANGVEDEQAANFLHRVMNRRVVEQLPSKKESGAEETASIAFAAILRGLDQTGVFFPRFFSVPLRGLGECISTPSAGALLTRPARHGARTQLITLAMQRDELLLVGDEGDLEPLDLPEEVTRDEVLSAVSSDDASCIVIQTTDGDLVTRTLHNSSKDWWPAVSANGAGAIRWARQRGRGVEVWLERGIVWYDDAGRHATKQAHIHHSSIARVGDQVVRIHGARPRDRTEALLRSLAWAPRLAERLTSDAGISNPTMLDAVADADGHVGVIVDRASRRVMSWRVTAADVNLRASGLPWEATAIHLARPRPGLRSERAAVLHDGGEATWFELDHLPEVAP